MQDCWLERSKIIHGGKKIPQINNPSMMAELQHATLNLFTTVAYGVAAWLKINIARSA